MVRSESQEDEIFKSELNQLSMVPIFEHRRLPKLLPCLLRPSLSLYAEFALRNSITAAARSCVFWKECSSRAPTSECPLPTQKRANCKPWILVCNLQKRAQSIKQGTGFRILLVSIAAPLPAPFIPITESQSLVAETPLPPPHEAVVWKEYSSRALAFDCPRIKNSIRPRPSN